MGICVYCDNERKLTKEHVFPNFLEKRQDEKGLYFNGAVDRYLVNAPVVKDVCTECNNVILGRLDRYASQLYKDYFCKPIIDVTKITFDSNLFIRWVLKVLFNAQRAFDCPYRIFIPYKKYMLGLEESPRKVFILGCVMKGSMLDGKYVQAKDLRVSDIRIPEDKLGVQLSLSHAITIRSYSFMVLSFLSEPSQKALNRTLKYIRKNAGYSLNDNNDNELVFKPQISKLDHVSHKAMQRFNNPNVYPNNGFIKVGRETVKLTNFPDVQHTSKKIIDNKIALITVSMDGYYWPLLGFKFFSPDLLEFSRLLSKEIVDCPRSQRASASIIRKGLKTYVTIHDKLAPGEPILQPTMGVHQTDENWELWKKGIQRRHCIYLCSGTSHKDGSSPQIHLVVSVVDLKIVD